jgi:hypothetical protein
MGHKYCSDYSRRSFSGEELTHVRGESRSVGSDLTLEAQGAVGGKKRGESIRRDVRGHGVLLGISMALLRRARQSRSSGAMVVSTSKVNHDEIIELARKGGRF